METRMNLTKRMIFVLLMWTPASLQLLASTSQSGRLMYRVNRLCSL